MAFNKLTATREELLEIIERQRQKILSLEEKINRYHYKRGTKIMFNINSGSEKYYQKDEGEFLAYIDETTARVKCYGGGQYEKEFNVSILDISPLYQGLY